MRKMSLNLNNYAVLQKTLAKRAQHLLYHPGKRAVQSFHQAVAKSMAAPGETAAPKSLVLLENLNQALLMGDVWKTKRMLFEQAAKFRAAHFAPVQDKELFAPEPYKELLLSYYFSNDLGKDPVDALDYLLIGALTSSFIYPSFDGFNNYYCRSAAWLADNDSEFFGSTLNQRLVLYARLLNDFADLLALGLNLPQISKEKIPFPYSDRPVIAADCFCGEILPLLLLPEVTEKAGLVFGVPFMDKPSVFALGNKLLARRGLVKMPDGELLLTAFRLPVRIDYLYPFAPDWELKEICASCVPLPGNFNGVRLVEEAPLWEIFPPELREKTPKTLIEVSRSIPPHPFFIKRQKSKISARLRYAFRWPEIKKIFIKPVNSLYGIDAFGFLERTEINTRRFRAAVDHIFNGLASYDHGNDESGRPKITPPHYWGFQIQEALNPIKITLREEEYSHKIRSLVALAPNGNYVFAGALAYLGKGTIVGGYNAEPVSLSQFAFMIDFPNGPHHLERTVRELTVQAANALVSYVKDNPYSSSVVGDTRPFLGNPNFSGYQMDWLGFDLAVEQDKTTGEFDIKFIEANDWRSGGAREILIDLHGENILSSVAPIMAHKAKAHFKWRTLKIMVRQE